MLNEIYSLRQQKLEENGYSEYKEYLKSEEWKTIKENISKRKGAKWNLCNLCTSPHNLEVHHSSYKVIGTVNGGNTLKMLCRSCHQQIHDKCKENRKLNLYKAYGKLKKQRIQQGLVTLTLDVVNKYNANH